MMAGYVPLPPAAVSGAVSLRARHEQLEGVSE